MVRQNASLENLVQVRAVRLQAAAGVRRATPRYAHAKIYQLLAWINGSFRRRRASMSRWRRSRRQRRGDGRPADGTGDDGRSGRAQDRRRLAPQRWRRYRKASARPWSSRRWTSRSPPIPMQQGRAPIRALNGQLGRLSTLEKSAQHQVYAGSRGRFPDAGATMAGAGAAVDRAVDVGHFPGAARDAGRYPRDLRRGGRTGAGPPDAGAGATAATRSPTPRARSTAPSAP